MQRSILLTTAAMFAVALAACSNQDPAAETNLAAAPVSSGPIPDFSGTWRGVGDVEPPPEGRGPVAENADYPPQGRRGPEGDFPGQNQTQQMPNPNDPLLQPWAKAQLQAQLERMVAGEIILPAHTMCRPSGTPGNHRVSEPMRILQTATQVTLLYHQGPEIRHIYLDVPHTENPQPTWYGESVGHYENGELVVDTIATNDKTQVDRIFTPHTEAMHVTERFRLIDRDNFEVVYTVTDPMTFTEPWTGVKRYRRVPADGPLGSGFLEQRCSENNMDGLTGEERDIPKDETPDF
jgi:hypothetical protein